MDQRLEQLKIWLTQIISEPITKLEVASADASFRRYFRVFTNTQTLIAMDAPPEKENSTLFIDTAKSLKSLGVNTPNIFAYDIELGFVLLEDFGDTTLLENIRSKPDCLYSNAIEQLVTLQSASLAQRPGKWHPSPYDGEKLVAEMSLFREWFLERHLALSIGEASASVWLTTQNLLASNCLQQPQVWVHRDFHSRNLMVLKPSPKPLGVIDFQDCVIGPIAYDLASIFKDCYIEWPRAQQHIWLEQYRLTALQKLDIEPFSLEQLIRWVDFAGLQRHLKVLGIFCRLNYRDGKQHYLNDLPLVAKYVIEVLTIYPELEPFKIHFEKFINKAL